MKKIPNRLWDALKEVLDMQHPSVAGLLRKYRYGYEADKVDELQTAYRNAIEEEEKRKDGKRNARRTC